MNIVDTELVKKVEEGLSQIRPYLENDGGDISLVEITDDFIVKVKLLGACETCEVSMMTLKNGVETAIKRYAPEIQKVLHV